MKTVSTTIKFFVLGLITLAVGSNMLLAQDIIDSKAHGRHRYNNRDTVSKQLRYSHNFQSGIAALDNCLNIKILDYKGRKMKKNDIRTLLADTPEALDKYNSGARLYTTATVLGIASLGILVVRLTNPKYKYTWMAASIGCSTGVVICRVTGTAKLKSAINIHNDEKVNRQSSILFPELWGNRLGWIGQTILFCPNSLNFAVASSGGVGFTLTF